MKKTALAIALTAALTLLAACSEDTSRSSAPATTAAGSSSDHDVYFGWLLGAPGIAGVAVDLSRGDAPGTRKLSVYVCDGLGPPEGMAVWFSGTVDETQVSIAKPLAVTAVGGTEKLVITQVGTAAVLGTFTNAAGATHTFAASQATGGAGIYQVTVDEALKIKGTSSDGSVLEGSADKAGTTTATITTAKKERIEFTVHNLSLASPADLAAHGLRDDYRRYAATNQVPGEYVALIAPGGSHWLGRAGAIRLGDRRAEIIGLDKKEFRRAPRPGAQLQPSP